MEHNPRRINREEIRELLEPLERTVLIDVLVDIAESNYETANYLDCRQLCDLQ